MITRASCAVGLALLLLASLAAARPLELPGGVELTIADGQAEMVQIDLQAADDLRVTVVPPVPGTMLRWRITCTDLINRTRWLELQLTARPDIEGPLHYWPGFQPIELTEPYEGAATGAPSLPLAALWSTEGGMAIGLEPHEHVSYIRHSADPTGERPRLTLHVRIVLDPGGSRTVTFVGMPVGRWGYLEALDRWYALAPEYYDVQTDIDPRINMCAAQYAAWPPGAPYWEELCRRNFAGWDWCYAPFKRTGDIVGRPELWDYEMAPGRDATKQRMHLDDVEAFHRWRREVFAQGERGGIAMLFYVPAMIWCEEALAYERYRDALTRDPAQRFHIENWVTGWDTDVRVLPWNTSYGEQAKIDLATVAEELDLTGFAFDTASGQARYRGPHTGEFASRAWDDDVGEFVREGIAISELIDYCHTLRNSKGLPLGVLSNLGFAWYTVAQTSDAGMRENPPWANERAYHDVARYAMGRKPICWWEGYDFHNLLNYEQMTPEQLADAYIGMSDFVINESYRWGYVPTVAFTRGIASAVRQLPTLMDCIQAGWEPVPAASVEGATWVARYGDGLNSRLVLGNETAQSITSAVEIDAQYLGGGAWLFSKHDGAKLTNRVLAGGNTRINGIRQDPRRVAVLRCRARVSPAPEGCAATVEMVDTLNTQTVIIRFTPPLPAGTEIELAVPAGYRCKSTTIDGAPVTVESDADVSRMRIPESGCAQLRAVFASEIFASSREELQAFPIAPEGGTPAIIVLHPNASESERLAAERLAGAVRAYFACALDEAREVELTIATGTPSVQTEAMIAIDGKGGTFARKIGVPHTAIPAGPRVGIAGRVLYIIASSPQETLTATDALLRVLDEKYFWPGYLHGLVVNRAVGVVGRYIGDDGRFHGTPPDGL